MNQSSTAPGNAAPYNVAEGTYGPHSSRLANAADPRVDSDRDHRGAPVPTGMAGAAQGPPVNAAGANVPEGTYGPHGSRLANAVDPRVDSDLDHRGAPVQTGLTGAGHGPSATAAGYNAPEGTYGPHSSRLANAADPRVDSDHDHRAAPLAAPVTGAHASGVPPAAGAPSAGYGTSGVTEGSYVAGGTPTAATAHGPVTGTGHSAAPVAVGSGAQRHGVGRDIKGAFAKGHGLGEIIRGEFNSAIDTLTGDKVGQAKNEEVARKGYREFETRRFEKKGPTDTVL